MTFKSLLALLDDDPHCIGRTQAAIRRLIGNGGIK